MGVEGSFDNWTTRTPLQKNGTDFTIVKLLSPGVPSCTRSPALRHMNPRCPPTAARACMTNRMGQIIDLAMKRLCKAASASFKQASWDTRAGVYQYKFVVDGEWKYDPSLPAMFDEGNNVNNVIEVQEYAPENLESLAVFDRPPSPDSTYGRPETGSDDYQKEPPATPLHLHLSLLNVPPALDAQAALPRPLHVILNHAYLQKDTDVRPLSALPACLGAQTGCPDDRARATMPANAPRVSQAVP